MIELAKTGGKEAIILLIAGTLVVKLAELALTAAKS